MPTNVEGLGAQFQRAYQTKVIRGLLAVQRAVVLDLYARLIRDTRTTGFAFGSPVWTGRYAASHRVSLGSRDASVADPHPDQPFLRWPDEPDSRVNAMPMSQVSRILQALKPFSTVIISNSLPYSRRIERGWSGKAPEGVYRVTADATIEKFRKIDSGVIGFTGTGGR